MRAARFVVPGKPFEVTEVALPVPGPGEVRVRVRACGVCASDIHLTTGALPSRAAGPVTPGHEPAGDVDEIGAGVRGWTVGDRVAVVFAPRACGDCPACGAGRPPEDCLTPLLMGVDVDGAWAEYVVVPARALVRLPETVSYEVGALLTDAVATPFQALVEVGGIRPGDRVAVFGAGGLGVHAVQLARLAGASFVAAVDPREAARRQALERGADLVVDPGADDPARAVIQATEGHGVDIALECFGANEVLAQALASLGRGGRAVVVGPSLEPMNLPPSLHLVAGQAGIQGSLTYRPEHYRAVLRLVESGRLPVAGSISAQFPLEDLDAAIRVFQDRTGDPVRIMLNPLA